MLTALAEFCDGPKYKRGQIYRDNLEPVLGSEQQGSEQRASEQQGTAWPCIIVSITPFNKQFRTVGGVPLSSVAKSSVAKVYEPVSVAVPLAGDSSVALCYQLRTVDKARLGRLVGDVSPKDLMSI